MVYQVGGHDAGGWEDHPHSRREFWSKSHEGAFLSDFEEGHEAGKTDIESGSTSYFDLLESIEKTERGNVWRARLDGYITATSQRGPTKYG